MSTVSISHGDDDQTELDFIKKLSKELGLVATVENSKPRKIQISRYPCDSDDSDQSAEDESHLAQMRVIKKYSSFAVMDDSVKNNNDRVNDEFRAVKSEYYAEKMHIREPSELEKFVGFYAQGLQWVMDYYYNGVQSWNWFFPYHYAPKISDLVPGIRGFYEKVCDFSFGNVLYEILLVDASVSTG
jgi:5'-3' exoribonuclease 1